jgi:hypothetical protein
LDDIADALDNIVVEGSFAGMAKVQSFQDVGLSVHGIGKINLPLQEEQVRQLIAQSRQASFGKGSDTIVDTAVRNTWELDASQLEFHGDVYERTLNKILNFVRSTLGITVPIRAELYQDAHLRKGCHVQSPH